MTRPRGEPSPPATTARPPARPAVPASLIRLRSTLRRELRRAGPATGALVFDLTAGTSLVSFRAGVRRPPASVEKLYTSVALLRLLDPHTRFRTVVLGAGHMGSAGVWHGNLYLRGGGDPTLGDGTFNRTWEDGFGPTAAQLASRLRARGITRVTGRVIGDGSLFAATRGGPATAFAPDIPDFGGELSALTFDHGSTTPKLAPEAFAARQFARTLRSQHVAARAAATPGRAPHRTQQLAWVSSPPLSVLMRLMDVPSDDLFAEMLTEQLGVRFGTHGTIAAGARVISDEIAAEGIHPRIVDGSGLSRDDASSPAQVVALLRSVWHTTIGRLLAGSLPEVGINGTVRRIGVRTPAQGHCVAKTGTLNYVTNLAGYCSTRGHHVLAFALFLDGPANWQALPMLSRMVSAIARY